MPTTTQAVGIVLIIVFVAFAFPTFISASDSSTLSGTVELEGTGDSQTLGNAVRLTVDSKTNTGVNLSVTAIQENDTIDVQLAETETKTVQLSGSDVTLSALEIANGDGGNVLIEVIYPRSLGWEEGTQRISRELPIILVGLALAVVALLVAGVAKQ